MPKPTSPSLFDVPAPAAPGSNVAEFSVSELSGLVKKTVEETFGQVRVKGEISECKLHSSGHIYITLKDETSVLASVCWRGQAGKLVERIRIGRNRVDIHLAGDQADAGAFQGMNRVCVRLAAKFGTTAGEKGSLDPVLRT